MPTDEMRELLAAETFGFRLRWLMIAAALVLVLVWPPRDPYPLAVLGLVALYNLAGRWILPRLTTIRRARVSATVSLGLLNLFGAAIAFSYSYLPESPGWLVFYYLPLSAALRFGMRGSIPQAAACVLLDGAAHYYARVNFGNEFDVPALVLRGCVYAGLAAYAGLWSRTVTSQRRALTDAAEAESRLVAAAEERARRLHALTDIQRQITERLDPGAVCQHVAEAAVQLLNADHARVWIVDPLHDELCASADAPPERSATAALDDATARHAATGNRLVVRDESGGPKSVYVPMRFEGKALGVLGVVTSTSLPSDAPDTTELLEALAASGAIAIENAHLFEVWGEAQALQRLDRMKSEFIGTISHELRTPLSAILGFADLLTDMPEASGEARLAGAQILRNSQVMARLVDDLLTFAQFERGSLTLARQRLDMPQLLGRVCESFATIPGGERASLDVDGPAAVDGDAIRLQQVVSNLVTNALRYAPDGPITLRCRASGDRVRLEVADAGPGVPTEEQARVWERFYRGRGVAGIAGSRATGLGLAVVKMLVEAHGGTVGLSSPPTGGATFWFELPAAAAAEAVPA